MERCRKCGKDYNLEDLPPSLRRTLKRCKECYLSVKKRSDTLYYISQGLTKKRYEKLLKKKKAIKKLEGVK